MIPDSLILMVASANGVRLIKINDLTEHTRHKVFDEPDFKTLNDISISQKHMAFACQNGVVRVLTNVFYESKASFKKVESPCLTVDIAPKAELVASG